MGQGPSSGAQGSLPGQPVIAEWARGQSQGMGPLTRLGWEELPAVGELGLGKGGPPLPAGV